MNKVLQTDPVKYHYGKQGFAQNIIWTLHPLTLITQWDDNADTTEKRSDVGSTAAKLALRGTSMKHRQFPNSGLKESSDRKTK